MGSEEIKNNLKQPESVWQEVRLKLRNEVGEVAFKSWLAQLVFIGKNSDHLKLAIPNQFLRDWVVPHYGDKIKSIWKSIDSQIQSVEIYVDSDVAIKDELDSESIDINAEETNLVPRSSLSPLDPRYTFENFIVGRPNEFAHAAALRVADSKEVSLNPLFLYGGVGLGKTHLMHAIAWRIREKNPNRRVYYLSAEKFMYEFVRALRFRDTMSFKERFRSVDVLMVDDVQFIAGKDSTQEEFFHTFNALVDQSKQVVVSGDRSPADLGGIEERLRSRLGWGVVGEIHPTTYELRLSILEAKAEEVSSVEVSRKILEFLAHRITSNVRELEGALKRLVAHSELVGRPITIETTQELLHDLLRANSRRLTIEEIQRKVADYFNVRLNDMVSARRARVVARPRQVAMYLAKQLTSRSLPEIGRKFGGRDHTTVMHAVRRVEQLSKIDSSFAEHLELIKRTLEG